MDRIPTKRLYLLLVVVFLLITFSVYSTYSIFTFESETEDIVSIHTPSDLSVKNEMYEYQQVYVPDNNYVSTDVDLYNNMDDELCYSVWYKVATDGIDKNKIRVYQETDNSLTTNSVLSSVSSRRVRVFIINDNDSPVYVNIGVIYGINNGSCELNIPNDKLQINSVINNQRDFANTVISEVKNEVIDQGYTIYTYNNEIVFDDNDTFYVARKFNLNEEIFDINTNDSDYQEIRFEDISNYKEYYTCFGSNQCDVLYYINSVNNVDGKVKITSYDVYVSYMGSQIGLRKVADDYYYFGDNPNNYVYYNCANELDVSTCELWRIIGFVNQNGNYMTKLIRNTSIGNITFGNQVWSESNVANYLNNSYRISNDGLVKESEFKQENIIDSVDYLDNINKSKIRLMSVSDYLNTSACEGITVNNMTEECNKKNWLNNKLSMNEYTLSVKYQDRVLDEEENEIKPLINDKVYAINNNIIDVNVNAELNVRPVVLLSSRTILLSGNGTYNDPFVIR